MSPYRASAPLTRDWRHFGFTVRGGVATIAFNRPDKLNALTFEVYADLRDLITELPQRGDVRVLVITGEGRLDDQSLHGKVISALAAGAAARGTPVLVLAGQVTLDDAALRSAGISAAFSLVDYAGSVRLAIDDAANQLRGLARRTASQMGE